VTPGSAGTIVLAKVLTVNSAIYCADDLSLQRAPGVTMFGFKRRPSMSNFWSIKAFMTAENTFSDASAQTWIS